MGATSSIAPTYKRLEGKVAIITGGASGIGASAVQLFHEQGAKVVIADIEDDLGQAIANKLDEDVCYVHCDVSKEDNVSNLVDTTIEKHGKLDIMYNNAGVLDRAFGSILDTTKADLDRCVGVNLGGAFLGAKHAARVMVPQRKGVILFTASAYTSIAGLSTHSYAASKYAVWGLARNLASEIGQYGIRVNCVSPYAVLTGMNSKGMHEDVIAQAEVRTSRLGNLQGEILKAEGIARAALYMASDEASFVSGLNLVVDGGFSVVNPTMLKELKIVR
ncbi:LOW QUALITY PROTEIN: tropinone reductase-like 1 [Juglans microcarpa x Juglans regia]|uniref:LOW QUALITY PROTEIN: tropinone reductase-like 1 n=1 Tax=Juglans microcarpa x Juglans regia TaxID=2249226 RepID=UPI001B7F12F2|nr:LOW QUALITY PROTEIN: tropinone reductase-like 1 [Juglans microcarpa x Juglans regia]